MVTNSYADGSNSINSKADGKLYSNGHIVKVKSKTTKHNNYINCSWGPEYCDSYVWKCTLYIDTIGVYQKYRAEYFPSAGVCEISKNDYPY